MQLRLDAADRLVELVEERRGPVVAEEAARRLFALRQAPVALARALLAEVVEADSRLAWNGDAVGLAAPLGADLLLEEATYVVVDLETTGLRPGSSQICEIGAVKIVGFEIAGEFETLVDPRMPLGAAITAITGLTDDELRGAPQPAVAVRRFLAFAGDVRARRTQRALRPLLSRPRDGTADRLAARRSRRGHGGARTPRPCGARAARVARAALLFLRHVGSAVSPGAARRAGDGGDPAGAHRPRAGARCANGRRSRRAVGDAHAPRLRQAPSRARRAAASGRLSLLRPERAAALRRPRPGPPRTPSLVLPLRAAAARSRGGARRGRADRMVRARLRARSRARGAAAHP